METLATPSERMDAEVENDETALVDESAPAEDTQVEEDSNENVTDITETNEYAEAWDKADTEVGFEEFFNTETTTAPEEPEQVAPAEEPKQGLLIENPVLKFKGREIPVESAEEMINLAQKGLKLEIEMSKIKPKKRLLQLIEQSNLTEEHISAFADVMKGNREALEYIARQAGIEFRNEETGFFEDEEKPAGTNSYKPDVPKVDPVKEYWETFTRENPGQSAKVLEAYEELDESFKEEIYKPNVFEAFVGSVVSGEFDEVYPVAVKIKAGNPAMTWLQAYGQAVMRTGGEKRTEEVKEPPKTVAVPKSTVKTSRPVKEKDIENRVWNDSEYEKELLNKLFN